MSEECVLHTIAGPIPLADLQFSAKLDFLTTDARAKQVRLRDARAHTAHGHCSVHDPSVADVLALTAVAPALPLHALEVSIDIRPATTVAESQVRLVLPALAHDFVRRHLYPVAGFIDPSYRASVIGEGKPMPFNRRHAGKGATLYYGQRSIAQVRAYEKLKDHGAELPLREQSARVEVTLKAPVLQQMGLVTVGDLLGFDYRKHLSRAFTFVTSAERQSRPGHEAALNAAQKLSNEAKQADAWANYGVGAFLPGGDFGSGTVRFRRHVTINARVGMALSHLTQRFRLTNVAGAEDAGEANPELAQQLALLAEGSAPITT